MDSLLFTPVTLGPLTLRNRSIRSAAFESMCPGNVPSPQLLDYHRSVAAGGVGMTTVAYAAVTRSGLSFDRQFLFFPLVYRSTFFHIVHASSFSRFQCRFGSISLSVE